MSLLSSALIHPELITVIYIFLLFLLWLIFYQHRKQVIALGLINNGGLFGLAAFIAIPFISNFPTDYLKLFSAMGIEFFCAFIFILAGLRIVKFLREGARVLTDNQIVALLLAKLFFLLINYVSSGGQYGVFSDDSRIDFLTISPVIAKLRYLDAMIDLITFMSIQLRIINSMTFRFRDAFFLLYVIFFGFLTGSKGGSLLSLIYSIIFIYAAFPFAFSAKVKLIFMGFFSIILFSYVYLVSEFLDIPFANMIGMSLLRFILNADARLMAFDPNVTQYVLAQPHGDLLAELFRGPSRLIGLPVAEFPIGVYQYAIELGTTNFVGSTNQLSAMFTIYGGDLWIGEFLIVASIMFLAYRFFCILLTSNYFGVAWVSTASLFWLSITFCQGFDAFVQMLPICIATVCLLWIVGSSRRRIKHDCSFPS